jgi:hypothetical protein
MRKQIIRSILMVAGVLTVGVILLSQTVKLPNQPKTHATKNSKQTEHTAQVVQAPSDVVTSPSVQLNDVFPIALKATEPQPVEADFDQPNTQIRIPSLSVLFRTLISPNAP